eukprot:73997_1
MKSIIVALPLFAAVISCQGFQVSQKNKLINLSPTSLKMGIFDFKPIHGSGSASEKDLDKQWEIQQEKLAERRDHLDKAHLKEKYKDGEGHIDIDALPPSVATHVDDMYLDVEDDDITSDDNQPRHKGFIKFKFPWDK